MNQNNPYHLPHNELLTVCSQSYALAQGTRLQLILRLSPQDFYQRSMISTRDQQTLTKPNLATEQGPWRVISSARPIFRFLALSFSDMRTNFLFVINSNFLKQTQALHVSPLFS